MKLHALIIPIAVLFTCFAAAEAGAKTSRQTDDQIRQLIIQNSIASYPGTCACPFNSTRNGSSCGRRSAWSKQGGYAPICYKDEVSKEMVSEWRKGHEA